MDDLGILDNIEGWLTFGPKLANGKQSLLLYRIIISLISRKRKYYFLKWIKINCFLF
jgi:hypothetical protein